MNRKERLLRMNDLVDQLTLSYNNGQMAEMETLLKRLKYHLQLIDKTFSTSRKIAICTKEELLILNQFNIKYRGLRQILDETINILDSNMKTYKQQHKKIAYGYFGKATQMKSRHINLSCK